MNTDTKKPLPASNKSCEKMLAILEFMADCKTPMRLLNIAKGLGYNQTTVLRFITTLQQCGYVAQEQDTQRYYLTFKLCRLSSKVEASNSLSNITHSFLLKLSDIFQESMCVSVEDHFQMVYVDVVTEINQSLMDFVHVGNIVPMHCTGNGKLLLSTFTEREIDRFVAAKGLPRYTEKTITTKKALMADLAKIRKKGYAEVHRERKPDMSCYSYPIRNYTGKIIAGISVTGPFERLNQESFRSKLPYLKKDAEEISRLLGFEAPKMQTDV